MAATIKWEFIKAFHRLRKLFVVLIALFGVIWILPSGWAAVWGNPFDVGLVTLSMTVGICILILSLYPMYNVIHDFRKKTYALERGTGSPFRNVVVAKIIVNLLVVGVTGVCVVAASLLFEKFNTESVHYFSISSNHVITLTLVDAWLMSPTILLFAYIVASTGRVFRDARLIGTIMIGAPLAYMNLITSGPVVADIASEVLVAKLLVAAIILVVTVWLAERKYEQHISNS
ncbi:MAG: hypothetical protein JW780_05455 [Clostridiales bacterium]|nr:hypothetical protein [Clostridiales bacterium]